jgi:hypothetical protein
LRCSNIDQDFAKGKKDVRERRGKGKKSKKKGKSEGKHTYPPTHHMCYFIID